MRVRGGWRGRHPTCVPGGDGAIIIKAGVFSRWINVAEGIRSSVHSKREKSKRIPRAREHTPKWKCEKTAQRCRARFAHAEMRVRNASTGQREWMRWMETWRGEEGERPGLNKAGRPPPRKVCYLTFLGERNNFTEEGRRGMMYVSACRRC